MLHSKSNSTKIKENEIEIKINNSINNINSSTKELNVIINENENYGKMSNLLCEPDNDEKIVNISKLDEVLYSEDKKAKNIQKHEGDSKFELTIGDQIENNNTNPIINISNLEMSIFKIDQKKNKSLEDNNHVNDNNNRKNNNINKITIIKGKDEVLKLKKKNCFQKLPFYCKIILIVNIFIILTFLLFFLFKLIINKYYY